MCAIKGTQFFAIITDNPYAPLDINEEPNFLGRDGKIYDGLFVYAGKLFIENNRVSIGYLQREFKIGFNRSSNIVDQLEECSVISRNKKDERVVNMTMDEFEQLVNDIVN